ncbi:MAG: DMT family transporter [Chloroflexi bacterium]|nr:DMT family transporter [Chloroflexota bacterium]
MTPRTILQPTTSASRWALAMLLLGASAIAFAPIFVRLSETGPISTAFWRLGLAVPVLWLGVAFSKQRGKSRPLTPSNLKFLAAAGFFFAGDLFFWHLALNYTSVANATLLPNMAPVFVTLGAWLLFRQHITRTFLLGLLLAIFGALMLIGQSFSLSSANMLGDVLALCTAVFYASYILTVKHLRGNVSALQLMAWSGTVCALILLPAALLAGEQFLAASWVGWLALLALALISHTGGQGLIAYSLAALPATFSSVSLLWQPVMAALLAWLILGEALSFLQILGGGIVLAGIIVARRGSQI